MLEKTRGIILHQIKYTDSGIVSQIYTQKFGRQSFMIKGMRSRKAGKRNILFQPLFILDIELYYKPSREMQNLKEFSVFFTPYDIYSNIKKSVVAMFLGEVLTAVLREESPHEEMFDFIEKSIIYFEKCTEGYANFHISFLSGLSSFLGFEPGRQAKKDDIYFDMLNGEFVTVPPVHGNYANEEVSAVLADFFEASYDSASQISLTGKIRNDILETLVRFYSLHLPGLRRVKSLEVLKEVFN
jgi:DNA repair protein RecO (recombination protein O)